MNIIFEIIAIVFASAGIGFLFKITPADISNTLMHMFKSKNNLFKKYERAKGKRKTNKLVQFLLDTKESLAATGKSDKFALIITLSVILSVASSIVVIILGYWPLVPAVFITAAAIPLLYAQKLIKNYQKHVEQEIKTAMGVITSSYIRCEDIIQAVKENLENIKYPVHEYFEAFIVEAETVSTDTKRALKNLKYKIDDAVFREWVDALVDCQSDRGLKVTLEPIVRKYTDMITVNAELETMLASPKVQYYGMVGLTVAIVPLLKVMSSDENNWFDTLVFTTPGKVVLGIAALWLVISYFFVSKATKPIKYES